MKARSMSVSPSDIYMFLFCLLMVIVFDQGGNFKYLWGAFVSLILLLAHQERHLEVRLLWFITPYIAYVIIGVSICIVNNTLNKYCFEQPVMYLVPFITALMVYYSYRDKMERVVYLMFLAITFVLLWHGLPRLLCDVRGDLMESKYAFIFGAYFLYFSYKKRLVPQLLAFFMLFLAHKRIALLGVGAVWILMLMARRFLEENRFRRKKSRRIIHFFLLFCFVLLGYIFITRSGLLNMIVLKFGINTQGRLTVYERIGQLYTVSPGYIGIGTGNVRVFLENNGGEAFGLLHNDILAIYIEIGFWGFITFFAVHAAAFRRNSRYVSCGCLAMVVLLYLYTFINYMTDNISIYISYLYPFYLMVFSLVDGSKKEKRLQEQTQCAKTEYA